MIENGFVKLPRNIAKRSWFNKQNTLKMYVVLLLNAAFKDFERDGVTIRAGQYVTSIDKLAQMCQLTIQQTRTALSHLVSTNDITIQTTSKFSIITLNSDSPEQETDTLVNELVNKPSNKQINNRSISNKEEVREESTKEEEEAAAGAAASPPPFGEDFLKQRLVREYGSELVELYENKFNSWASAKNAANVPMYSTIAKWLAQDKASMPQVQQNAPQAISKAHAQASGEAHIDTERLRQAVMAQYRTP